MTTKYTPKAWDVVTSGNENTMYLYIPKHHISSKLIVYNITAGTTSHEEYTPNWANRDKFICNIESIVNSLPEILKGKY